MKNSDKLSQTEVNEHLEMFVKSFFLSEYQHRWQHFLFEKPEKASRELVKFYHHYNSAYCKLVKSSVVFFEGFVKTHGKLTGIYFDGDELPQTVKVSEVEEMMRTDAVFSIEKGKLALFLTHEYEVFLCEKRM
jgi:hypothetical protein